MQIKGKLPEIAKGYYILQNCIIQMHKHSQFTNQSDKRVSSRHKFMKIEKKINVFLKQSHVLQENQKIYLENRTTDSTARFITFEIWQPSMSEYYTKRQLE